MVSSKSTGWVAVGKSGKIYDFTFRYSKAECRAVWQHYAAGIEAEQIKFEPCTRQLIVDVD